MSGSDAYYFLKLCLFTVQYVWRTKFILLNVMYLAQETPLERPLLMMRDAHSDPRVRWQPSRELCLCLDCGSQKFSIAACQHPYPHTLPSLWPWHTGWSSCLPSLIPHKLLLGCLPKDAPCWEHTVLVHFKMDFLLFPAGSMGRFSSPFALENLVDPGCETHPSVEFPWSWISLWLFILRLTQHSLPYYTPAVQVFCHSLAPVVA